MSERQKVKESIEFKYGYHTPGTGCTVKFDSNNFTWQSLKQVAENFIKDFNIVPESVYFEYDTNYGYYDSIDTDYLVHGERWETDIEMNKRIEKEEKNRLAIEAKKKDEKRRKEENDLKEYERLRKKFGDKS